MELTDGIVGLLIGGFLGVVLGVIFEEPLQRVYLRTRRRLARPTHGNPRLSGGEFRLGPLSTDCIIVEGDGESVIEESSIYVAVNTAEVVLPDDMKAWRDEVEAREEARRSDGEAAAWNGALYAIEKFSVARTPLDERPEVYLRLQHSDFYTFLAAQQLDRALPDGTTPRQRYIANRTLSEIPAFVSCGMGVNVVLITKDQQVLFSRRSDTVALFPSLWSVSANESVSRAIDSQGRSAPNLYGVARRGAQEELGLGPDEYELRLLAFHLATEKHLWGCDFVARLSTLTAEHLRERWTRGRPDSWEHSAHEFVPFNPRDVLRFVLTKGLRREFTSMGPAIFYLALVNEIRTRASRARRRRYPSGVRTRAGCQAIGDGPGDSAGESEPNAPPTTLSGRTVGSSRLAHGPGGGRPLRRRRAHRSVGRYASPAMVTAEQL